jgi:hypothetical protein
MSCKLKESHPVGIYHSPSATEPESIQPLRTVLRIPGLIQICYAKPELGSAIAIARDAIACQDKYDPLRRFVEDGEKNNLSLKNLKHPHCRGVILNAPEHVLSYKLSGMQHLADSKLEAAREMVQFQSWLTATCRDVLDESDFTLAVKTQLIYPSGPHISVDGHPHRWEVAHMLLSLVEGHLLDLQRAFPRSIEVVKRPHGFPKVHFLQTDVEDDLC